MIKYLTIALFLFTITDSAGQSSNWTIGLKPSLGWSGANKTTGGSNKATTDQYGLGFSYGVGAKISYQFSKYFSVALDPEWQFIRDKRSREYNILDLVDVTTGNPVFLTSKYKNSFQRIQAPLSIHFSPAPNRTKTYLIAGIMPSYIFKGKLEFVTTSSSGTGAFESGKLNADFDIPANKGKNKDLIWFAGLGIPLTKRFSAEVVYQFNKPFQYTTFDPGSTYLSAPVYSIRANQGLMFSIIAKLN